MNIIHILYILIILSPERYDLTLCHLKQNAFLHKERSFCRSLGTLCFSGIKLRLCIQPPYTKEKNRQL